MNAARNLVGRLLLAVRADRWLRGRVDRRFGNPLRIFCGHRVIDAVRADSARDRADLRRGCLTLESFHRRVALLHDAYRPLSLSDAAEGLCGAALPPGAVVLTFDDGYADVFTAVYPALRAARLPFTVFLTTGWIGRPGHLTKEQIRRMAAEEGALIEWGAHGVTHRPLTALSAEEANREIAESKETVEALIGRRIQSFCYPEGRFNEAVRDLVSGCDFRMACATGRRLNVPPGDPLALQRIPFEEEPFWRFALRAAGRV